MDCTHSDVSERMCNECGMIVEKLEMVRGWNSQNLVSKKSQSNELFNELVGIGVCLENVRKAHDALKKACAVRKSSLKGKRKRGFVFACLFDLIRGDPDELRKKMNLLRPECERGVALYEELINLIGWHWTDFVKSKLKKFNLERIEDEVLSLLLKKPLRSKLNQQVATAIISVCKTHSISFDKSVLLQEFANETKVKRKLNGRLQKVVRV